MRKSFDEQLENLNVMLIEMGSLIETSLTNSAKALIKRDKNLAREMVEFDELVNEKEREIESICLKLLLQQQPVAKDLRLISTALKIITDMERIGDQSADIAQIVIGINKESKLEYFSLIEEMFLITKKMVKLSIDAYSKRSLELCEEVIALDVEVNQLFDIIKIETIKYIEEKKKDSHYAVDIIMISKYLERVGDHAQNIAEWVIFAVTGTHKNRKVFR